MSKKQIFGIVIVFAFILLSSSVLAIDYFSYRMNFPPGESREHVQTITYQGSNLSITIPSNFSVSNITGGGNQSGSTIIWDVGNNTQVNYTLTSPSNCTEDTTYTSQIYLNGSYVDKFVFVCLPDSKIIDHKVEYGHGYANYLTQDYIENTSTTLFNLIRVFNIGQYLTPNEDASNVTVQCLFDDYTVRTYGRSEISYNATNVISNFSWDSINGGYWFRIGVVSQDFTGESVGYLYNVTCSELVYYYDNTRVVVPNISYSLEVRSCDAISVGFSDYSSDASKTIATLTNSEKYDLYELYFVKILDSLSKEEHIIQLNSGQSASYLIDRNNTYNFTFQFIPSWHRNSLNPEYCVQQFNFNGSIELPAPTISSCQLNVDNSSVDMNWTNVSGATSYNVYYSSNISQIMLLDPDNVGANVTTITGITDLNYTDTNAADTQYRYYTIAAVAGNTRNVSSSQPCAKFTYNYTAPNSTSFGVLASNRINLYINYSVDAETFLQGISNQTNPAISRLDKSNSSGEFLTTHIKGFAANNFTLEPGIGYEVAVNNPAIQTIVGRVSYTPYILEYTFVNSTTYGSLATNWNGVYHFNNSYNASEFLSEIPYSLPAISRLDKSNSSGEFLTTHIKGFATNIFDLLLGVGYELTIPADYNHTLCVGCFS